MSPTHAISILATCCSLERPRPLHGQTGGFSQWLPTAVLLRNSVVLHKMTRPGFHDEARIRVEKLPVCTKLMQAAGDCAVP